MPFTRQLKARAGLLEERDFLGRRRASQYLVAMREAAESADHVAVTLGPWERFIEAGFRRERCEERDGAVLLRKQFTVLERHVQEPALERFERSVEFALDGILGRRQRAGIAGEGVGRAAKGVARELVEQHDARKTSGRRRAPVAESAGNARSECRAEAHTNCIVERIVLAEPGVARHSPPRRCFVHARLAGARNEPEIEDFG